MDKLYHRKILKKAVGMRFAPRALDIVTEANLGQDSLSGLVGHPEYHFDDSAFEAGYAYMQAQREQIWRILRTGGPVEAAWRAFGRLTHAAQDFYAHSNYVALWTARLTPDAPPDIDPLDEAVLASEALCSGKIYWLEVISLLPALRPLAKRLLPADSHAAMNMDNPAAHPLFFTAMSAARKRTIHELDLILAQCTPEEQARFLDG